MTMYQIKATYLDGPHAGKSYVLTKGGYVAPDGSQYRGDCYETVTAAKAISTKRQNRNKRSVENAKRFNAWRQANGLPGGEYIEPRMTFEPIEVEIYC